MSNQATKDTNPCGICRAMGSASCKGHGGGASGDGPETEEPLTLENQPTAQQISALSSFLENSADWQCDDDFLFSFNNFNEHAAVSSLTLDLAKCELNIEPEENLDLEQKQDLKSLFNQIQTLAQQIDSHAQVTMSNGSLNVKLSDPKLFDPLISKLMNKNLIPQNAENLDVGFQSSTQDSTTNELAGEKSWAPNPFDISKGPTPYDN